MKSIQAGLVVGVALCVAPLPMQARADDVPPAWAYAVNPPDFKPEPDDGKPRHVPDSTAAFRCAEIYGGRFEPVSDGGGARTDFASLFFSIRRSLPKTATTSAD